MTEQPNEQTVNEEGLAVAEDALDDDEGYEPDTDAEPDDVEEDELPDGDSGEFDGAIIDDNEPDGVAQPDEPMESTP